MKAIVALLLAAALCAASVHASVDESVDTEGEAEAEAGADTESQGADASESDSMELTTAHGTRVVELGSSSIPTEHVYEFGRVVGGSLPVLVEFYLPSCGHCQGFAPEYERVAHAFSDADVVIARVDANRWNSISDHYYVKSVPDIRFYPANSDQDTMYRRARVATDVVEFVNEYAGTKVVFDYSFKQQHAADTASRGAAEVVDEGTCPVLHTGVDSAFVEVGGETESDAELDSEDQDFEGELGADEDEHEDEADVGEEIDESETETDAEGEQADAEAEADAEVDDQEAEADEEMEEADAEDGVLEGSDDA